MTTATLMTVSVSKHGLVRCRQRVGLGRKAARRHARMVYHEGVTHAETTGLTRRCMDRIFRQGKTVHILRLHGHFIYLFTMTWNGPLLVTVCHINKAMQAEREEAYGRKQA
jgi:hypothetical protein